MSSAEERQCHVRFWTIRNIERIVDAWRSMPHNYQVYCNLPMLHSNAPSAIR